MGYKTKIDWCDSSWSPVTGCKHDCPYCYARSMVNRFGDFDGSFTLATTVERNIGTIFDPLFELDEPRRRHVNGGVAKANPYPFGFLPTFHRYRLGVPARWTEPRTIFVGSMCDLFGDWVPDEWIQEVFKACDAAPQHRYLFLTKNAERLPLSSFVYSGRFGEHPDNFWFGTTITDQKSLEKRYKHLTNINGNTFLSVEPLSGSVDLSRIDTGDVLYNMVDSVAYYLGGWQKVQRPGWVIIGAESGNRKGKVIPKREWIDDIVSNCLAASVPVFMKESLRGLMGDDFVQEYPWEV